MRNLREVLQDVAARKVALGHFNISDLVAFNAIKDAAKALRVPVMIGVSEGERSFVGVRAASALVREAREEGVEMFLNADHTHSLEKAEEAARAGFDEILFDGSKLPMEENLKATRQAVEAIRKINPEIVIEGEIGYIGSSSEILKEKPHNLARSTPGEAVRFVQQTGVDVLAPAVGNMHGLLESMVHGDDAKRLDIPLIEEIGKAAGVPLTLHGGSGTADEDVRAAIKAGIRIIHVNTELRLAWRRGLEEHLQKDTREVAPYKILPGAYEAVRKVVEERLKLFNGL